MTLSAIGSSSLLRQLQQTMFKTADADGDGALSSSEFGSIGQSLPGGGNNVSAKGMSGRASSAQDFSAETLGSLLSVQESRDSRSAEIFASADANGDGTITADELAADMASHAPKGAGGDTSQMAADLVSRADKDGDGVLSADEFKAAAPKGGPRGAGGPPPGPPPTEQADSRSSASGGGSQKTYDAADTNKDGTVSMSELLASLQSSSTAASGFSTDVSDVLTQLISKLTDATTTGSTVSVAA